MNSELLVYGSLLSEIKTRVRKAQIRAALSANAEMIAMYWDIGRMILERQNEAGWGAAVIPRLAVDLRNELPEIKGFSERNIKRMLRFYKEYSGVDIHGEEIVPQAAALLNHRMDMVPQAAAQTCGHAHPEIATGVILGVPWFHHVVLFEKIRNLADRIWYMRQCIEQGWTRETLTTQIKNRAHERQGQAVTNFSTTLPTLHAGMAISLLKDPYIFDFLTLEEPFHERELEAGLVRHLEKFLLEIGAGFAFVGRQYRLAVSDRDFYLDLLFYHLKLRCFIVIELKTGDFKPEYAGKMNFYCSVVDDQLRTEADKPTIGLILCQTKDKVLVEYTLRDIHKPIGISEYELTRALPDNLKSSLPSVEELEAELEAIGRQTEDTQAAQ